MRDSSFDTAAKLLPEVPRDRDSVPYKGKRFFSSVASMQGSGAASYIADTSREANSSHQSDVKIRNCGAAPQFSLRLYVVTQVD
jgi:hypothetical protein